MRVIRAPLVCLAVAVSTALGAALTSASDPSASAAATGPQIVYAFEREWAAGIEGAITIQHSGNASAEAAWVLASLDFSGLALDDVRKSDPQCKDLAAVREFQYHIHVDWHAKGSRTSDAFAGCAKPATGNHYDPTEACGPASEHVGTPVCEGKTAHYKCTPERYAQDPRVCEKGDLSGKLGHLIVDAQGFASGEWKDAHFPLATARSPLWSIVLHAVCGSATPRIACAVGVAHTPVHDAANDDDTTSHNDVYLGEYDDNWIDELRV